MSRAAWRADTVDDAVRYVKDALAAHTYPGAGYVRQIIAALAEQTASAEEAWSRVDALERDLRQAARIIEEDYGKASEPWPSLACPAGGEHTWIEESPADFHLITGRSRSQRSERVHCQECNASPRKASRS